MFEMIAFIYKVLLAIALDDDKRRSPVHGREFHSFLILSWLHLYLLLLKIIHLFIPFLSWVFILIAKLRCTQEQLLFEEALQVLAEVIAQTGSLNLFTDGERRYGNLLFFDLSSGTPQWLCRSSCQKTVKRSASSPQKQGSKKALRSSTQKVASSCTWASWNRACGQRQRYSGSIILKLSMHHCDDVTFILTWRNHGPYSKFWSNQPQQGSQGKAPQWVLYSYLWRVWSEFAVGEKLKI